MTLRSTDLKPIADQVDALVSAWDRYRRPISGARTARQCVELGIQLLMLKQACPHGSFLRRVEALRISVRTAQLCMEAARRFRNAPEAFFNAVGSVSKMLELLSWDGADALAEGKNVGGVNFGLVAQMTARELRAEIRFQRERSRAPVRAPTRPVRTASLTDEEERMLSRFRKCNSEGRTALVELAGLLAQAPT